MVKDWNSLNVMVVQQHPYSCRDFDAHKLLLFSYYSSSAQDFTQNEHHQQVFFYKYRVNACLAMHVD